MKIRSDGSSPPHCYRVQLFDFFTKLIMNRVGIWTHNIYIVQGLTIIKYLYVEHSSIDQVILITLLFNDIACDVACLTIGQLMIIVAFSFRKIYLDKQRALISFKQTVRSVDKSARFWRRDSK